MHDPQTKHKLKSKLSTQLNPKLIDRGKPGKGKQGNGAGREPRFFEIREKRSLNGKFLTLSK
jgi:hypothetical protein